MGISRESERRSRSLEVLRTNPKYPHSAYKRSNPYRTLRPEREPPVDPYSPSVQGGKH